jgi:phosphatidylglycerol---prolipoprotein diacylglyceryl transferase
MFPILFSFGPITIFSFSVFLVLAWLVFSFLFWRNLRSSGTEEDRIFDLTFYATIVAFIVARLAFVATHWELFADTWLKIIALWVQPGLSLYGGIVGGVATLVTMSRSTKVRLGLVLDALAGALPIALIIGLIGAFLDGTVAGKITELPWAMRVVGHVGRRHPVALYEIVALGILLILQYFWTRKAMRDKKPYGVLGVWFLMAWSAAMFILELFKESHVYLTFTANQWVLIAIFAESLGALYVRGGGRESIRPLIYKLRGSITRITGGIYAKFSNRRSE